MNTIRTLAASALVAAGTLSAQAADSTAGIKNGLQRDHRAEPDDFTRR